MFPSRHTAIEALVAPGSESGRVTNGSLPVIADKRAAVWAEKVGRRELVSSRSKRPMKGGKLDPYQRWEVTP